MIDSQVHNQYKVFTDDTIEHASARVGEFFNDTDKHPKSLSLAKVNGLFVVIIGYVKDPDQKEYGVEIKAQPLGDMSMMFNPALLESALQTTDSAGVICHDLYGSGAGLVLYTLVAA